MGALGASALGAGLLGDASRPLSAEESACSEGGTIIDTHIHIWKLPRSLPPMSDFGTHPGDPTDGVLLQITPANPSGVIPWLRCSKHPSVDPVLEIPNRSELGKPHC